MEQYAAQGINAISLAFSALSVEPLNGTWCHPPLSGQHSSFSALSVEPLNGTWLQVMYDPATDKSFSALSVEPLNGTLESSGESVGDGFFQCSLC